MFYKSKCFNYLVCITCIMVCTTASSQKYNVVKLDGIGIFSSLHVFRPSFERNITQKISVLLYYEKGKYSSGTIQQGFGGTGEEIYKITGWGIMPEIRYYPFTKKKTCPSGFFAGAFIRYRKVNETFDGNSYNPPVFDLQTKGTSYNDGIDVGYKWVAGNIIVEVLGGYGTSWGNWEWPNERNQIPHFYKSDLYDDENAFRLEISLGLIFPKYSTAK